MKQFRSISALLIVFLLCQLTVLPVFAEKPAEPLSLRSSTIVDGDSNVSVRPVIELVFSGKVDDITVVSYNKDRFHLQNSSGDVQPLSVRFPDTQVQNLLDSHVFLIPEADLVPGQTYTLTVDNGVTDKKSNRLEQSLQIHFTTATDENFARLKENDDLNKLGNNVLTYNSALAPAASSDAGTDQPAEEVEQSNTSGGPSAQTIVGIAVPILVILLALVFYSNWKKTRQQSDKTE